MSDESTIMEMMEEMEACFKERDGLFQKREEAYRKRYDELLKREADLKEKETALSDSWKEHEAWAGFLTDKQEEIRLKEEELENEIDLREEEYDRLKKKMKEDQLRINLLETRLQNESLKQDADRLRSGIKKEEAKILKTPALLSRLPAGPEDSPEYRTLKEDKQKLSDENVRLYDQLLTEMEIRKALEKEKQELFRLLLTADPEAARLFEEGNPEEAGEETGAEEPAEDRDDPSEKKDGERSEEG